MSSLPLVSIVISTFSPTHLIGKTLDSVLKQIYKNWECLVADDYGTVTVLGLKEHLPRYITLKCL